MVNPGGTGKPAFVISASPAPLPPSTSFIVPFSFAGSPPAKDDTNLPRLLRGSNGNRDVASFHQQAVEPDDQCRWRTRPESLENRGLVVIFKFYFKSRLSDKGSQFPALGFIPMNESHRCHGRKEYHGPCRQRRPG